MADILQEDVLVGGMVMRHLRQRDRHYLSIFGLGKRSVDGSPDAIMRFLSYDEGQAVSMYAASILAANAAARKTES